jgi:hypothetical protein
LHDETQSPDQIVRTGMTWTEVQDRLGAPDQVASSRDGDMRRVQATYGDRGLELTFLNDVLVRIRQFRAEPR